MCAGSRRVLSDAGFNVFISSAGHFCSFLEDQKGGGGKIQRQKNKASQKLFL